MIWFTIKFVAYFVISFLLLSITINKSTIFNHLNDLVGPVGNDIKESLSKGIDRTIDKSTHVSKELFDNSKPKGTSKKYLKKRKQIQNEDIKSKDQESLDNLIEKEN